MKLSVIIVSYNVRYFLEKCIGSVERALLHIEGEVIVIDNNSSDKSVEMMKAVFPNVKLIANTENVGFATACNQGIKASVGEYILLLNPDTLVSEDTFRVCQDFMDNQNNASACGVRMVDGTGSFLPESMRGLPSPLSAFFKMTGLGTLFPHSTFFNGYYMGRPDPQKIHPIPVLTGAFMFMRRSVIDKIGMLDEDYFMYGEDIDLCYRMIQAGYQNYYLPASSIIHYKGESTQRGSLRYIIHFYRAMMIYVSKNVRGTGGGVFRIMIILAVMLRASIGGVQRVGRWLLPVLIDAAILVGSLVAVQKVWSVWYFRDVSHFDQGFQELNIPVYTGIWLLFLFLSGAYDVRRSTRQTLYGMLMGTVVILITYALLPAQYRSSRAVIFLGAFLSTGVMLILHALKGRIASQLNAPGKIVIVGSSGEVVRIMELMNRIERKGILLGWIACSNDDSGPSLLGHVAQIEDILRQHRIREVIFSAEDLSYGEINRWMATIGPSVSYRISSKGSDKIVGSDSKTEQGSLYSADIEFALAFPGQLRAKRIFDLMCSLILLGMWPVSFILGKGNKMLLQNIWRVTTGKKTWIGYHRDDTRIAELPQLKPGVLNPYVGPVGNAHNEIHMINYIYAREYHVWKDVDLFLRNMHKLYQ